MIPYDDAKVLENENIKLLTEHEVEKLGYAGYEGDQLFYFEINVEDAKPVFTFILHYEKNDIHFSAYMDGWLKGRDREILQHFLELKEKFTGFLLNHNRLRLLYVTGGELKFYDTSFKNIEARMKRSVLDVYSRKFS